MFTLRTYCNACTLLLFSLIMGHMSCPSTNEKTNWKKLLRYFVVNLKEMHYFTSYLNLIRLLAICPLAIIILLLFQLE